MLSNLKEKKTMYAKPDECKPCALVNIGNGFVFPEGFAHLGVGLIGEAAGANEAADGLPFRPYAEAGSVLERCIRSIGLTREQFALSNILSCQPPGNSLLGEPYEVPAIAHCVPTHLARNYERIGRPPVLLALGATATKTLTGLSGDRLSLDLLRGFPLMAAGALAQSWCSSLIVPTYHPAYITRGNQSLILAMMRDLSFAVSLAKTIQGLAATTPLHKIFHDLTNYNPNYVKYANEFHLSDLLKWLRANPDHPLSYDFETPYEEGTISYEVPITQVNFSLGPRSALVCDWTPTTAPFIVDILACTKNPKFGHNVYHFDNQVALHNGFEIRGSRIDDTLQSFHFLYPDLPGKALKKSKKSDDADDDGSFAPLQFCASYYGFPIPWKHLYKIDPHQYGAYDSDSAYWVRNESFREIVELGSWGAYDTFVRQLREELAAMERRGFPASPSKLQALSDRLAVEIAESLNKIQVFVPKDLLDVSICKKLPKPLLEVASRVEGFVVPTPDQVAKGPLSSVDQAFLAHVENLEVFNPDGKLVGRGFVVVRSQETNVKCSCLQKRFVDEALPSCGLCLGSGVKKKKAKTSPCPCVSSSKECPLCLSIGTLPRLRRDLAAAKGKGRKKKVAEGEEAATACSDSHTFVAVEGGGLRCTECSFYLEKDQTKACKCRKAAIKDCETCQGSGKVSVEVSSPCKCRLRVSPLSNCELCFGSGLFTGSVNRWAKLKPFNVNSPKQILRYVQAKGYRIPLNSKRKVAMDKETMYRLGKSTGDPIFSAAKDHRELSKIKGTYADGFLKRLRLRRDLAVGEGQGKEQGEGKAEA